jgi:CRP-like cAMP-binding protein
MLYLRKCSCVGRNPLRAGNLMRSDRMLLPASPVRNRLLAHLPPTAFAELLPHLRRVRLHRRQVLQEINTRISSVYFLECGVAVLLARSDGDRQVGVGVVGRLGLVGVPAVLGTMYAPNRCIMEIEGAALQIGCEHLSLVMDRQPLLRRHLLRYIQALLVQNSQTTLCNIRHKLEERLARWLLLAHDRIDGNVIPLTHDLFSMMLGVRRASVTEALAGLEAAGALKRRHKAVEIQDRPILEQQVCDCYRIIAAEYQRLFEPI